MLCGQKFGRNLDYYQAISCYKKAHILKDYEDITNDRLQQIEYSILLAYYLGGKYDAVCEAFEGEFGAHLKKTFKAYPDLLIILFDSYLKQGNQEKAQRILQLISQESKETLEKLSLYGKLLSGNLSLLSSKDNIQNQSIDSLVQTYEANKKSPQSAGFLNALLPGAGYLYVGQKTTALTSFCLNALFIAAAWQFFHKGQVAAGIITSSFEIGWYAGGIKGASIAAKEYNQTLYSNLAKERMINDKIFPIFMLHYGF